MNEEIVQLTLLQAMDHQIDEIESQIQGQQDGLESKRIALAEREATVARLEE